MEKVKENNPTKDSKTLGIQRNEKGQLLPGSVLNPEGKTGPKLMSTILREVLMEIPEGGNKTKARMIIDRLTMNAISGKEKSIEMTFDRTEGKVKDEFKGEITGLLAHGEVAEDKLDGLVDTLLVSFKQKVYEKIRGSDTSGAKGSSAKKVNSPVPAGK